MMQTTILEPFYVYHPSNTEGFNHCEPQNFPALAVVSQKPSEFS